MTAMLKLAFALRTRDAKPKPMRATPCSSGTSGRWCRSSLFEEAVGEQFIEQRLIVECAVAARRMLEHGLVELRTLGEARIFGTLGVP